MATALGYDMLVRYYEATEAERVDLLVTLGNYRRKRQISDAEYDRAVTGEPPTGYVAPTMTTTDAAALEPTSSEPAT